MTKRHYSLEMWVLRETWISIVIMLKVLLTEGKINSIRNDQKFEFHKIILNTFVVTHPRVNILTSAEIQKFAVHEIVGTLMKGDFQATFTLNAFDEQSGMNVILVDSINALQTILGSVALNSRNINVIIPISGQGFDSRKTFKILRDKNILRVFLVQESTEGILVTTFNPFLEGNCNNFSPVVVANLTNKKIKLSQQVLTTNMVKNFHNCPIRISLFCVRPAVIYKGTIGSLDDLKGREVQIIKLLSKTLNFTIELIKYEKHEKLKAFCSLSGNLSDVLIGDFYLNEERARLNDHSISYFSSELGFVVPNGLPYTSIERLINSFQPIVWLSSMSLLLIAALVIIVVKMLRQEIQAFIFGRNITTPMFNLVSIVLGMPLTRLPGRNFARFLLMSFLMFCLVMRSLHQGAAFKFLQSNMNRKSVESLDDIIEEKYSIFMFSDTAIFFTDERVDKSKIITITVSQLPQIFENLKDPSFKGVFAFPIAVTKYYNNVNMYNFVFKICKQRLAHVPVVFYLQKGSIFTEIFNEKLIKMMSAGLIEYWHKFHLNENIKPNDLTPKPLTIYHLSGIFQVFFLGSAISIIVFIIERVK